MKVFDELIAKTLSLLPPLSPLRCPVSAHLSAREGDPGELLLRREIALELGEGSFPSVSMTAITQDAALVAADEIWLCGADLPELSGDGAFARITLIRTDDIFQNGDQAAFNLIRDLELKKFAISPQGYMVRPSALSNREQVRVAKSAVRDGLRFANVGNLMIEKYHENKHVQAVKLLFITLPDAPYGPLDQLADQTVAITRALNHAIADLNMDCRTCQWKPVCDTVDGMKELHETQIRQKEERT